MFFYLKTQNFQKWEKNEGKKTQPEDRIIYLCTKGETVSTSINLHILLKKEMVKMSWT